MMRVFSVYFVALGLWSGLLFGMLVDRAVTLGVHCTMTPLLGWLVTSWGLFVGVGLVGLLCAAVHNTQKGR